MHDWLIVSKNLKYILNKKDIAHNVLANEVGISTSTMSRYVNGQQQIPLHNLMLICDYLQIMPKDLEGVWEDCYDIFLIGNGFDLAHGLTTMPRTFLDYFSKKVLLALKHQINLRPHYLEVNPLISIIDQEYVSTFDTSNMAVIKYKTAFLNQLMETYLKKQHEYQWSDIEQLYFKHLYALHKTNHAQEYIDDLQNTMCVLVNMLNGFINEIETSDSYYKVVSKPYYDDIFNIKHSPEKKFFINFNYTNTLSYYINEQVVENSDQYFNKHVVNIHGLAQEKNVVFGYGGELSKGAIELNQSSLRGVVDFFKSNHYILNGKYSLINQLINNNKYRLHILGLACGMSDSMLLKSLFYHDNLDRINLYYYPDQEQFLTLFHNVNKLINNAGYTLRKVSPYSESKKMNQVSLTKK